MRRPLTLAVLLVSATLAVYLQVCAFEFVDFDDGIYVASNPHVLHGLSWDGIRWAFSGFHDGNWIPLTWLSLMLDGTFYGDWPGGYHITNMALHSANVLLLFAALTVATRSSARSAFAAALFAVHPLHAESVAWIAERKDVLSIFFGMLSLLAYVIYVRISSWRWLAAACCAFVCSLLSKATLVTLPFVFLLLDFWPLGRFAGNRVRLVIEKVPFFLASAAISVVALLSQSGGGGTRSLEFVPLGTRFLNAILAYGLYLEKALFPFDLAYYYPHPGPRLSLVAVGISFACLAAITAAAVWLALRSRGTTDEGGRSLLVGWLWYLGTLVPMIGIVQIGGQQLADRYAYFPMIGIYLALAWLVPSLWPARFDRRRLLPALAIAMVLIYAVDGFVQAGYWHDSLTLFDHALAVAEENPHPHRGLGSALFRAGKFAESAQHLQRAVELEPGDAHSHYSLGRSLQALGRIDDAAREFQAAIKIDPNYADPHNDLGLILHARQDDPAAKKEFERAIALNPSLVDAYGNLAMLYGISGQLEKCVEYCERALRIDASNLNCRRNLAVALTELGRTDRAIAEWRAILAITPNDQRARAELSRLAPLRNRR